MRNFDENNITYVRHPSGRAPNGRVLDTPCYHLNYDFGLKPDAGKRAR
jgi:hydroxyquinol 1,2-dioxygenase